MTPVAGSLCHIIRSGSAARRVRVRGPRVTVDGGDCSGTASVCPAGTASPTGKPRRGRRGRVPPSRSTSSLCRGIRPRTACQLIPLAPRNIHTDTERAGSRLIPPRSIRLAGILMNGRARCHVPAPGTAVPQALTARIQYHPDTVQCVRIADRVTIHDDYISVEPGAMRPLRCPSPHTQAAADVTPRSAPAGPNPSGCSIAGACRTTSCGGRRAAEAL